MIWYTGNGVDHSQPKTKTDLKGLAPKSTSVGVKTVTSKVDSASSFSSVTSEHFHGPVSLTFRIMEKINSKLSDGIYTGNA